VLAPIFGLDQGATTGASVTDLRRQAAQRFLTEDLPGLDPPQLQALAAFFGCYFRQGALLPQRQGHDPQLHCLPATEGQDHFVHADLAGFLGAELDRYVGVQLLDLDRLARADQERQACLALASAVRDAGRALIGQLAQAEARLLAALQRPKLVLRCDRVLPLAELPAELAARLLACPRQRQRWRELLRDPRPIEDLDQTSRACLPVNSAWLEPAERRRLLAQHQATPWTGLCVASDNLQAMRLLAPGLAGRVHGSYTDPPYNTGGAGFIYRDGYSHRAWLGMMADRLLAARLLLAPEALLAISIDEREHHRLIALCEQLELEVISTITVKMSHMSGMKMSHIARKPPKIKEYLVLVAPHGASELRLVPQHVPAPWGAVFERYTAFLERDERDPSDHQAWRRSPLRQAARARGVDPKDPSALERFCLQHAERVFRTALNRTALFRDLPRDHRFRRLVTPTGLVKYAHKGEEVVFAASLLKRVDGRLQPALPLGDIWLDIGINNLHNEGGTGFKNGKKPTRLVRRALQLGSARRDALYLDLFAGSGTIGHAVIDMNRDDGGARRFVALERGAWFDTHLVPRILRAAWARSWKGGVPRRGSATPIHLKLLRLESFQDALERSPLPSRIPDPWSCPADLVESVHLRLGLSPQRVLHTAPGLLLLGAALPGGEPVLMAWRHSARWPDARLQPMLAEASAGIQAIYLNDLQPDSPLPAALAPAELRPAEEILA